MEGPRGPKGEKGQDGTGSSGVKYVRWGRTTCPSSAQIVYKGKVNNPLRCPKKSSCLPLKCKEYAAERVCVYTQPRSQGLFPGLPPSQGKDPGNEVGLYSGIVGGSDHGHTGGGGEYVCLPNNPKNDKYQDGYQSHSYVYGTEYQIGFNPFKNKLHDHDAPMCRVLRQISCKAADDTRKE